MAHFNLEQRDTKIKGGQGLFIVMAVTQCSWVMRKGPLLRKGEGGGEEEGKEGRLGGAHSSGLQGQLD